MKTEPKNAAEIATEIAEDLNYDTMPIDAEGCYELALRRLATTARDFQSTADELDLAHEIADELLRQIKDYMPEDFFNKYMEEKGSCVIDGHHGIYLPQQFAKSFDLDEWNVDKEDIEILLAGPDHENYWDVWDDVLANARYTDANGVEWALWQDDDLFAYPTEGLK